MGIILKQEAPSIGKVLGTIIATTGIVVAAALQANNKKNNTATASSSTTSSSSLVLGNVFLFISSLANALWALLLVPLQKYASSSAIMAWEYVFASVLMVLLVFCMYTHGDGAMWLEGVWTSAAGLYTVLYAGVMCSACAYAGIAWGVEYTGPTLACLFSGLQIPFTSLFAYIWNGENIEGADLLAGVSVIVGLVVSSYSNLREYAREEEGVEAKKKEDKEHLENLL